MTENQEPKSPSEDTPSEDAEVSEATGTTASTVEIPEGSSGATPELVEVPEEERLPPLDPGGELIVEPLAQQYRAVIKDLDYEVLREMFDRYWDAHGEAIAQNSRVKTRKKKGGKAGKNAKKVLESSMGFKKLYSEVLVQHVVSKIGDVLHISAMELHDFKEGAKPVIIVAFYYLPKLEVDEINLDVPYQMRVDEEKEYRGYCEYTLLQNRTLEDFDGDEIDPYHNVLMDVTATMDGQPFEQGSLRMQWMDLDRHPNKTLVNAILEHKKGDLFETEWLHEGKVVSAQVKIHALQTITYPELDDEFAKDLEFDSLDAFKEKFINDYRENVERQEEAMAIDGIISNIVESVTLPPLPEEWVEHKSAAAVNEHIRRVGNKKRALLSVGAKDENQMQARFRGQVYRTLVQQLAVKAYAEKYDLGDEEEDIKKHMKEHVNWIKK